MIEIPTTIKKKWKFREKEYGLVTRNPFRIFDNYTDKYSTVGIFNVPFDELVKFHQDQVKGNFWIQRDYKILIEEIDFTEMDKRRTFFKVEETTFSYDLIRKFFRKGKRRFALLGHNKPLIIEYKKNWTIVLAPRVLIN